MKMALECFKDKCVDFNMATHGGLKIIQAAWNIIDGILPK